MENTVVFAVLPLKRHSTTNHGLHGNLQVWIVIYLYKSKSIVKLREKKKNRIERPFSTQAQDNAVQQHHKPCPLEQSSTWISKTV